MKNTETRVVGVVGLGHVGQESAKLFSNMGWTVVGYDVARTDHYPVEEFRSAQMIIICVDTPTDHGGKQVRGNVETALEELPYTDQLVVLRSTVVPGATDELAERYGIPLIHWPEYFGETQYANHYWPLSSREVPFSIVGGPRDVRELFLDCVVPVFGPEHTFHLCSAVEAELIKYMENCYLATKVTFVNEFYDIAKSVGASWHAVREGWLLDPRISRAHTAVFPDSRGFGGKCLPKDVRAIVTLIEDLGLSASLVSAVLESNARFGDNTVT